MRGAVRAVAMALFENLVAVLDLGEDNKEVEVEIAKDVAHLGGRVVDVVTAQVTHAVVSSASSKVAVAASKAGAALVTEWWVDSCQTNNKLLPVDAEVVFSPAKSYDPIPSLDDKVVCVTGYAGYRRAAMRELVSRTGARYSGTMNRDCTHLVCFQHAGEKYLTAKRWQEADVDGASGPKIVNHRWLEDCLRAWFHVPEDAYTAKSGEQADEDPIIPLAHLLKSTHVVECSVSQHSEEEREHGRRYRTHRAHGSPVAGACDPITVDGPGAQRSPAPATQRPATEEPRAEPTHVLPHKVSDMMPLHKKGEGKENVGCGDAKPAAALRRAPGGVGVVGGARRQLRELKGLELFSWDAQKDKFPPGAVLDPANPTKRISRRAPAFQVPEPKRPAKKKQPVKRRRPDAGPEASEDDMPLAALAASEKPRKKKKKQKGKGMEKGKGRGGPATKTIKAAAAPRACRLALSGMRSKARAAVTKQAARIAMEVVDCPKQWHASVTHLITPHLGRSEKVLAAMAAGVWILHRGWVRDSAKKKRQVDESNYFAQSNAPDVVDENAAEFWRRRRVEGGRGAFAPQATGALRATFHDACNIRTPSKDTLSRIFEAGGGTVVPWGKEALGEGEGEGGQGPVDFAVIHPDIMEIPMEFGDPSTGAGGSHPVLEGLARKGVPMVSEAFIIEWLALPHKDLCTEDHVLRGGNGINFEPKRLRELMRSRA